jgi:hypothetical protein
VNTATLTSTSGGSGGAAPEVECETAEDCTLFSDCCACVAQPRSEAVPSSCGDICAETRCRLNAIDSAICFAGQCIVGTAHNCSPLFADCDTPPPECPEGYLPSVANTSCWTGTCVPAELCGNRPDCSSCADDEVCFRGFNDVHGPPYYCMPRPSTCEGEATCECARHYCDALGFSYCAQADDGLMQCSP